jgi:hypothetical protein
LIDSNAKPRSITVSGALTQFRAEYAPDADWLLLESATGSRWEGPVLRRERVEADFHGLRAVRARIVDGPWAAALSEAIGRRVRLVCTDDGGQGFDVHPVTLLGTASVDALARNAGLEAVDSRRFRMLIELETSVAHIEDTWQGRRLLLGTAELIAGGGVPRCAAVTRQPDTGIRDTPIVEMIRSYRGVTDGELGPGVRFGVYADVLRGGTVRVGDQLGVA